MKIDTQSPEFKQRVNERLTLLGRQPALFLSRFDLNSDGVLDEIELAAATSTISNEILNEHEQASKITESRFEIGTVIDDRFELISILGQGAQSTAFVAQDLQERNLVVLKQMRLSHLDTWDAYTSFQRESEFLQNLDHPRLPDLVKSLTIIDDTTNDEKSVYSVQSFRPGQNLETRSRLGFLFTETRLLDLAEDVLKILAYLHGQEEPILHRDVKPSNILLCESGEVSLVDFGAVQYVEKSKTMAMGSAGYMPSEQLLGNAIPQSDLHALGVTLIRLASGVSPENLEMKGMKLIWRQHCSLSDGFSNWIDKLIEPAAEDRFKTATAALRFLRDPNFSIIKPKELAGSLTLEEVFVGKPEGSRLRVWESVDQFVCTFPGSMEKQELSFLERIEQMFSRFVAEELTLEEQGGGFSMDSSTQIRIQNGEGIRAKQAAGKFTPLKISRESFGKKFALSATRIKTTSSTLVLGLNREELDWLWERLELFCEAHNFDLLVPETAYQTYIKD